MIIRSWRKCIQTSQSSKRRFSHIPVMADEISTVLNPDHGKTYIDMTFGAGGHSKHLLKSNKSITIVAIDRDPVAIDIAHKLAAEVAIKSTRTGIMQRVIPIHGRFSKVIDTIHMSGIPYQSVNGIIIDLGASSMQFDSPERGFAVSADGPLDMRMDTSNSSDMTAEDVINNLDTQDLATIFKTYGEERRARKMANAIIDARTLLGRIRTTTELKRILSSVGQPSIDALGRHSDVGTKVFQALRTFVNNELNELNYALEKLRDFLIPTAMTDEEILRNKPPKNFNGVAAVLSFHSLEDKIIKHHFSGLDPNEPAYKKLSQHDRIRTNDVSISQEEDQMNRYRKWRPLFKTVKRPASSEIDLNPRSRSAKLRFAVNVANSIEPPTA